MNSKKRIINKMVIYSMFLAIIFMKIEVYGKYSNEENLDYVIRQINNEIKKENMDESTLKIKNLGIVPFSVSTIGYEIDFSGYKGRSKNIKSSSIENMTSNINLNKTQGEPILFKTKEFNFDTNASILVMKNGVRDKELERILKGEDKLGQKYIKTNESGSIIKVNYPKQMMTYDKYEIIIYMRVTLNDEQKINKYLSNYVYKYKCKNITVQNKAKLRYEISMTTQNETYIYIKNVSTRNEIDVPYRYPPRIY